MSSMNRIILIGSLTAEPDVQSTTEGGPIAKFHLRVERPGRSDGVIQKDMILVTAWRQTAE